MTDNDNDQRPATVPGWLQEASAIMAAPCDCGCRDGRLCIADFQTRVVADPAELLRAAALVRESAPIRIGRRLKSLTRRRSS